MSSLVVDSIYVVANLIRLLSRQDRREEILLTISLPSIEHYVFAVLGGFEFVVYRVILRNSRGSARLPISPMYGSGNLMPEDQYQGSLPEALRYCHCLMNI